MNTILPFGFLPAAQMQMYNRPAIPNGPRVAMRPGGHDLGPRYQFTVRRQAFLTDLDHKLFVEEIARWCTEQVGHDPRFWSQYMDLFFIYDDDLSFAFRLRWA